MTRVDLGDGDAGGPHGDRIVAEVRHPQIAQEQAAIGMGVGAHAAVAAGREGGQLGAKATAVVE